MILLFEGFLKYLKNDQYSYKYWLGNNVCSLYSGLEKKSKINYELKKKINQWVCGFVLNEYWVLVLFFGWLFSFRFVKEEVRV